MAVSSYGELIHSSTKSWTPSCEGSLSPGLSGGRMRSVDEAAALRCLPVKVSGQRSPGT